MIAWLTVAARAFSCCPRCRMLSPISTMREETSTSDPLDEELEDASVPLADRIGLLDSAWRLLPDVAREDTAVATRLKAELQSLVGPDGPSATLIAEWEKRFPAPSTRTTRAKKTRAARADEERETEESAES